ncbi:MAG: SDR family NAD(P)-dependent oxidoreductase [Candidatus Binataceae bacterium]
MKILITGGAGFIGCNAASRFLKRGDEVVVLDNLSRNGARNNLEWLRGQGRLIFRDVDIRDTARVAALFREHEDVGLVLHLAAQVAVTTSVADPRLDFEVNVLGTINVLEGARLAGIGAPLIYSSSNKVYGQLNDVEVAQTNGHCSFIRFQHGISEERNLDFHSPYGCSKGAADSYVRDYHRIYGMNTVVMRQSCIYGRRQFGMEDQGWVVWFMIATESGQTLTIYGDGRQVRDVLHVDDLIDAFEAAARNIGASAGSVYNIGGGPDNAICLLDVVGFLERQSGRRIVYRKGDQRPGDQRVYISDIRRAQWELGWSPRIGWEAGLTDLYQWVWDCDGNPR